jgi:L-ascorbate metabolism protein UlaG (beta-lactamase superfamily)
MLIRWFGHSSFYIISDEGVKIITDPYMPISAGGFINCGAIKEPADIVTVSHDHGDHSYTDSIPAGFEVFTKKVNQVVKTVRVKGVDSFHDTEFGAQRGKNVIFTFDVDNIRICHLGDLGHVLSFDEIENIGGVDMLLIPIGGKYTIDPDEANTLVSRMNPRIVIPMHYKTDKVDIVPYSVDEFIKNKSNVAMLNSSSFEVTKEDLPDETQIIVLKHEL